ncbi:hypothetical protein B0T09DRAFT_340661, partial [Sordaria sp. MPI-SDFR-AT-0083]
FMQPSAWFLCNHLACELSPLCALSCDCLQHHFLHKLANTPNDFLNTTRQNFGVRGIRHPRQIWTWRDLGAAKGREEAE